jgi:hypothetical protein
MSHVEVVISRGRIEVYQSQQIGGHASAEARRERLGEERFRTAMRELALKGGRPRTVSRQYRPSIIEERRSQVTVSDILGRIERRRARGSTPLAPIKK